MDTKQPQKAIRGDFHLHTEYSVDSRASLTEIIAEAKKRSINCLAVTDHDVIRGALEMAKCSELKIIVGEEISSSGGHIIGLFLQELIPRGLSVNETIARIKAQGGLAVAAHPFSRLAGESALQEELVRNVEFFDAIEVANSNNLIKKDDQKARDFAEKTGLPMIGGSDAHVASGVGTSFVEMDDFNSPEEFLESLRSGTVYGQVHSGRYMWKAGIDWFKTRPECWREYPPPIFNVKKIGGRRENIAKVESQRKDKQLRETRSYL